MNAIKHPGASDLPTRLSDALCAEQRILAAYLHGSFGKATFREDSDVDCAVLLYPGITLTAQERLHLEAQLGATLGVRLDLGVLTTGNLIYFIQAVHHGTRLLCRDEALADAMVGRAYSLYARLKEDRKEVEAAYRAA